MMQETSDTPFDYLAILESMIRNPKTRYKKKEYQKFFTAYQYKPELQTPAFAKGCVDLMTHYKLQDSIITVFVDFYHLYDIRIKQRNIFLEPEKTLYESKVIQNYFALHNGPILYTIDYTFPPSIWSVLLLPFILALGIGDGYRKFLLWGALMLIISQVVWSLLRTKLFLWDISFMVNTGWFLVHAFLLEVSFYEQELGLGKAGFICAVTLWLFFGVLGLISGMIALMRHIHKTPEPPIYIRPNENRQCI